MKAIARFVLLLKKSRISTLLGYGGIQTVTEKKGASSAMFYCKIYGINGQVFAFSTRAEKFSTAITKIEETEVNTPEEKRMHRFIIRKEK